MSLAPRRAPARAARATTTPTGNQSFSALLAAGEKIRCGDKAALLSSQAGRAMEAAKTPPGTGAIKAATTPAAIVPAIAPMSNPQPSVAITSGNGDRQASRKANTVPFARTATSRAAANPAPAAILRRCNIDELSRAFGG